MRPSTSIAIGLVAAVIMGGASESANVAVGTVADEFRNGVLGFEWGTDLEAVARSFPTGTAWPVVSRSDPPVERYYAVPDDLPVLAVKRDNQHTMFGFDRSNRLITAVFAMPYSSRIELMARARSLFGEKVWHRVVGLQRRTVWEPSDGITMEIIDIPHPTRASLFVVVSSTLKE